MPFSRWRGIVGMINPTMRPGATEEVVRMLPHGIGLIPLFLDFRGTTDEFKAAMPTYERNVALLAEHACDLIHPAGAPPFMMLGRKAEGRLVATWEKKYKTTIFTVAQNYVAALKTLKARTIVGATYFPGKVNDVFAKYLSDAGFTVRGMEGIEYRSTRCRKCRPNRSMRTSNAASSDTRASMPSTCWDRVGAPWISFRPWNETCRRRWSIRSRHESGKSRSMQREGHARGTSGTGLED